MKSKKNKKKAIFFSTDALIALSIILIVILVVYPVLQFSPHESELHSDVIKVLSSLKIGEVDSSYVQTLISEGKITDENKNVLEQIGEFYVTNKTLATNLASSMLSYLNTSENIGIWYGNVLVASKNSTPIETASNIETDRQIISGIEEGGSVTGFSARAYLESILQKKYFYFGGYVGDGNISALVNYNGTLKGIEIEITINKDFDIYINNIFSGHYENSSSVFSPAKYDLEAYLNNFNSGENIIKFVTDEGSLYIAGGFIKITYNESAQIEQKTKYRFPGIDGIINLYDGFYVPGELNNLNIFLHLDSNYSTFLVIGNTTVFNASTNGEKTITITDSELSLLLNYQDLNRKTTPLRIGLEELQVINKGGNADVVLITDLSGSMDFRLDSDNIGVDRNCDDVDLSNSNTKRISLAKCLDKMVVDIILNSSGNRLALSGFYGDGYYPYKGRVYEEGLTNNASHLKSKIDDYFPQGGTPICAAINDAYKILNEQSDAGRAKFVIVMSDGIPTHRCQATSGCEGTRTGLPSEEALWLGWGAGCYGGLDDCNVNDCQCASQNANWSACRVYNYLSASVYSIGFGPVSSCRMANATLRNIANCGRGKYYASDNATLLTEFYRSISEEIIELSYVEQTIEVKGNISTILYPDSYIEFNYSEEKLPYGLITTIEKQFYNNYYGTFSLPINSEIIETKVISYSGPRWTEVVEINDIKAYKLSDYGQDYTKLGDPYAISIPNSFVKKDNIVNLTTAVSPTNSTAGSNYNKIIYTIKQNASSYSEIKASAEGCRWNLEFEDNTKLAIAVPDSYSGTDNCFYEEMKQEYNSNDAIQVAVYNLLKLLDLNLNGKIDIKFTEQDLRISSNEITGIPYAWYTEVQVRRWY